MRLIFLPLLYLPPDGATHLSSSGTALCLVLSCVVNSTRGSRAAERKKAGDRIQLRPIMPGAGPLNVLSTQDSGHTHAGVPEKMQDPKGASFRVPPPKADPQSCPWARTFPTKERSVVHSSWTGVPLLAGSNQRTVRREWQQLPTLPLSSSVPFFPPGKRQVPLSEFGAAGLRVPILGVHTLH